MNRFAFCSLAAASLFFSGCSCTKCQQDSDVVSKRYIHKYGYDVSPKEWEANNYPGKVITTLHDGITVTSAYNNGVLDGETTTTHPHSHILAARSLYERGTLCKTTSYDSRGIPEKEVDFLSPSRRQITRWYKSGVPMSIEVYEADELLSGAYHNSSNEVEYKVTQGEGMRVSRDERGKVVMRETILRGYPILKETFYPHGIPQGVTPLLGKAVHGEKKVYARTGEPVSSEQYDQGFLHGQALYYQNGLRYLEVSYQKGLKHGTERHFVDGETLVEETQWYEGKKHGPSIVHFDGISQTRWYYNDELVSKDKYRQLSLQEDNIAIMQERSFPSQNTHVR